MLGRGEFIQAELNRSRIIPQTEAAEEPVPEGKEGGVWTARGLEKGGVPLFLPATLTADGLFSQVSRSGVLEQRRSRPVEGF